MHVQVLQLSNWVSRIANKTRKASKNLNVLRILIFFLPALHWYVTASPSTAAPSSPAAEFRRRREWGRDRGFWLDSGRSPWRRSLRGLPVQQHSCTQGQGSTAFGKVTCRYQTSTRTANFVKFPSNTSHEECVKTVFSYSRMKIACIDLLGN